MSALVRGLVGSLGGVVARRPRWRMDGKVVVVTGAGSGIGRELAREAARRGARLALSDIDADGLAETVRLARADGATDVRSDRLDVAEQAAVAEYAGRVAEHFGVVNLVVNNAGIAFTGSVEQSSYKDIARIMDVDYWGVVHGTKEFLPHLIASGDGHVINISSLFGILAVPGQAAYNSAKFAVRGFTEALRMEMAIAKHPVKVTTVHPGGIKTAIARNATVAEGLDQGSLAETFDTKLAKTTPEKAAQIILDGVAKNKARVLVGLDAKVIDGLVRLTGSGYQRGLIALASRFLPSTR